MDEHIQRTGEPLNLFIQRRIDEGALMKTIADELDCNYRTLMRHMRDFGIERRNHSDSVRLQWQDNEERRKELSKRVKQWAKDNPERARENSVIANLALQTTSPTSIEKCLMQALDDADIQYEFQYTVGGKFLCDFAFPDAMLIVECDGSYWHSTPKQKQRDASKDAYLQACGYTVLRLSDKQIEKDINACIHAITALLG